MSDGKASFGLQHLADVQIRDLKVGDRLTRTAEKWADEESDDGSNVYDGGGAEQ